jgi:hypothetical protein
MKKRLIIIFLIAAATPLFAFRFSASSYFNAKEDSSKKDPTFFYQDSDIRLFDGGKKILLGFAAYADSKRKSAIYYSDTGKLTRVEKTVPIDSFFASHPELLLNNASILKSPNVTYPFTIKKLIHYDETSGTASLVVQNLAKDAEYDLSRFRYYIVNWDLKDDRITSAHLLADGYETVSEYYSPVASRANMSVISNIVHDGFYDKDNKKGYVCFTRGKRNLDASGKAPKESTKSFVIAECTENGVTEIVSQNVQGRAPDRFFFDQATSSILAIVYTEFGAQGSAYLVNLADKSAKLIMTPLTAYCAAFDPDGTRLYMLSNKTGKIRVYNRKTDKVMQEYYAGTVAWRIGFVQKEELAFFNKDGIQIISTRGTLKTIGKMPAAQYTFGQKPYNYPQGGLITEGNIYIGWNGTLFHVTYK